MGILNYKDKMLSRMSYLYNVNTNAWKYIETAPSSAYTGHFQLPIVPFLSGLHPMSHAATTSEPVGIILWMFPWVWCHGKISPWKIWQKESASQFWGFLTNQNCNFWEATKFVFCLPSASHGKTSLGCSSPRHRPHVVYGSIPNVCICTANVLILVALVFILIQITLIFATDLVHSCVCILCFGLWMLCVLLALMCESVTKIERQLQLSTRT